MTAVLDAMSTGATRGHRKGLPRLRLSGDSCGPRAATTQASANDSTPGRRLVSSDQGFVRADGRFRTGDLNLGKSPNMVRPALLRWIPWLESAACGQFPGSRWEDDRPIHSVPIGFTYSMEALRGRDPALTSDVGVKFAPVAHGEYRVRNSRAQSLQARPEA